MIPHRDATTPRRPLIVHVIHALRVGGLENGLVNLINRMPAARYRHAVVCLTDYDRFAERIERDDVAVIALHKRAGKDPALYGRLWKTFRTLRPSIVHTRNLAALEALVPAWLAGVGVRVHGEHGRDIGDLHGKNVRHRQMRRALRPLVQCYIPLSRDLEAYLRHSVAVPDARITRIINGVDVERFRPDVGARALARLLGETGWPDDSTLIGWVGRMEAVKSPLTLVEAFARLRRDHPRLAGQARLVLIGDGSQYRAVERAVAAAGLGDAVWLPGARDDVAELLRGLDLFVLPSLAEGISNTILEALASGLPVIATDVGGNAELVEVGCCGQLVPVADTQALGTAIAGYLHDPVRLARESWNARDRAVDHFSIDAMVTAYTAVYDRLLAARGITAGAPRMPSEID